MSNGNGSSNTAIVAIVVLILAALFFIYFFLGETIGIRKAGSTTELKEIVPVPSSPGSQTDVDINVNPRRDKK